MTGSAPTGSHSPVGFCLAATVLVSGSVTRTCGDFTRFTCGCCCCAGGDSTAAAPPLLLLAPPPLPPPPPWEEPPPPGGVAELPVVTAVRALVTAATGVGEGATDGVALRGDGTLGGGGMLGELWGAPTAPPPLLPLPLALPGRALYLAPAQGKGTPLSRPPTQGKESVFRQHGLRGMVTI